MEIFPKRNRKGGRKNRKHGRMSRKTVPQEVQCRRKLEEKQGTSH